MTKTLTAEQAAEGAKTLTAGFLRREEQARTKLAEHLAGGKPVTCDLLERLLSAQADASNWRRVATRMARGQEAGEAVRQVRVHLTESLLEVGESRSTSAITNDMARMEREAVRTFLEATRTYV